MASWKCFSNVNLLCIGLLKKSGPKLVAVGGVHEDELAVAGGQTIVNDDLHPLTEMPKVETEDTTVVVGEALVRGYHLLQEVIVERKIRYCSQQPAVT